MISLEAILEIYLIYLSFIQKNLTVKKIAKRPTKDARNVFHYSHLTLQINLTVDDNHTKPIKGMLVFWVFLFKNPVLDYEYMFVLKHLFSVTLKTFDIH